MATIDWAPSCPLPRQPLSHILRERLQGIPVRDQLREQVSQRLRPNSCRICRQETEYLRRTGRYTLEEESITLAYLAGRGYRHLLTAWWSKVSREGPTVLPRRPAVSTFYRHMSGHLGLRTEAGSAEPREEAEAKAYPHVRSGGWAPRQPPSRDEEIPDRLRQILSGLRDAEDLAGRSLPLTHPLVSSLRRHRLAMEGLLEQSDPAEPILPGMGPETHSLEETYRGEKGARAPLI